MTPPNLPDLDALEKDEAEDEDEEYKGELDDVRNACLVSRKVCDIAQPLVFREFDDLAGDVRSTIALVKAILICKE